MPDETTRQRELLKFMGHDLPKLTRFRVTCAGRDCLLSGQPQTYDAVKDALDLRNAHKMLFGPSHQVMIEEVDG